MPAPLPTNLFLQVGIVIVVSNIPGLHFIPLIPDIWGALQFTRDHLLIYVLGGTIES